MSWLWKGNDEVIFETAEQRKRKTKIKNIKYFSVAAFILLFVVGFIILRQYDFDLSSASGNAHVEEEETTVPEETKPVTYAYGKSTIMFYCVNDNSSDVLFLAVMRADMDEGFIKIHPISTNEKILSYKDVTGNVTGNAVSCYKAGGSSLLREACENYLGTQIDRYIGINKEDFENITINFPQLQLYFDEAVTLNRFGDTVSFSMGNHMMTDAEILKFMSYDGREENAKLSDQGYLLECMINQYFDASFVENSASIFSRIINLLDTDVSVFDLTDNKRAFEYMANKNADFECEKVLEKEEFISFITEE